jgi:hypothetical protein
MLQCHEEGSIKVGNAHLLHNGLFIGFTQIDVADWDDFSVVIKYCKAHIGKALTKVFPRDIGELCSQSGGLLGLKPGRTPQDQFMELAESFKGDPLKTKILIGWCVMLNLEIQLNPELRRLEQATIASYYVATHAWKSAFKVPLPQDCRGRLVDIPADVLQREQELYDRHRLDKPESVGVPGIGSSRHFTAFGISSKTWGEILVTKDGTYVGVFEAHMVKSKTNLSKWLGKEGINDRMVTIEEFAETLKFRVHHQKEFASFRLLPKMEDLPTSIRTI